MIPLIIYHLKRKYICKTEAELKEAWAPGDLGYGTRIPADMLILTIVLCYSVIAPVIIPFGVIYFGLGWLVLRNQVMVINTSAFNDIWSHQSFFFYRVQGSNCGMVTSGSLNYLLHSFDTFGSFMCLSP